MVGRQHFEIISAFRLISTTLELSISIRIDGLLTHVQMYPVTDLAEWPQRMPVIIAVLFFCLLSACQNSVLFDCVREDGSSG